MHNATRSASAAVTTCLGVTRRRGGRISGVRWGFDTVVSVQAMKLPSLLKQTTYTADDHLTSNDRSPPARAKKWKDVGEMWARKDERMQPKRLGGGRESAEWGERDLRLVYVVFSEVSAHTQGCNVRKGSNPTALFCICPYDDLRGINEQGAGMVRRGVRMIRERLPRLEVARGMEPDFGKKALSGA